MMLWVYKENGQALATKSVFLTKKVILKKVHLQSTATLFQTTYDIYVSAIQNEGF